MQSGTKAIPPTGKQQIFGSAVDVSVHFKIRVRFFQSNTLC